MPAAVDDGITAFFDAFSRASEAKDWQGYGGMFLDRFLSLDPTAARVVGSDALVAFLPQRDALFARAGARDIELLDVEQHPLDETHVWARTHWRVDFVDDRAPVLLDTTFLLRREDGWKIAVYLNHESLLDLLDSPRQP